jgi:hypothetical protein
VTAKRGHVTVEEGERDGAASTIRGTVEAWVRALGPGNDRKALKISGDKAVAGALLEGLTPVVASEAAVA